MRYAAYTDYAYSEVDGRVSTERAFALFLAALAQRLPGLVVLGRLDPEGATARYELPPDVGFVALPHYPSLARPLAAAAALARSLRRCWRALDDVEGVWLLGPHPLSIALAALALLRRRRVVLGVRQDLPEYVRTRHPGRRRLRLAALGLEAIYRALARALPTVVVGPDLARRYHRARRLLPVSVSLVREHEIAAAPVPAARYAEDELRVLSVGRLETEKNPLLLADILALLRGADPRWRLLVCGEGDLEDRLVERLRALGVEEHAELLGYVPLDRGLFDLYRRSHVLLHVSWTEGLPQVLFEAFAAGLPVVATAVGGVAEAASGAALLVPPGDASAAADALARVTTEPALRTELGRAGLARARAHTLEAETSRVAAFLLED